MRSKYCSVSKWSSVYWAIGVFLVLAGSVSGQIIPATNAPTHVWAQAGVPGGIPNRTTIYTTLSPGITASQLQTAINNCPSNQVVYLNAGTYNIGAINLGYPTKGYWTLRGAGMGQTILNLGSGSASWTMGIYPPWTGTWANTQDIVGGLQQGSSNVTVSSASSYVVGDHCVIDMVNADWIVGAGAGGSGSSTVNGDSAGKGRDGNRVQLHTVQITGKSGNQLAFWPPLPFELVPARSPQISRSSNGRLGPVMAGIEDLTMNCSGSGASGIQINSAHGFWMKNVEFRNWGTFGIWPRWTSCFEMRGCYVHTPIAFDWGKGYGLQLDPASGCLIVDNTFYRCQEELLLQGGCAGNVLAYNFVAFSYNGYIGPQWQLQEMAINHTPFPCYNLFEGNYTGKIQADYYYGPSGWGVILRNRVSGNGPWTTENRFAIGLDARQRYYSVVGNQLGERTAPTSVYLAKPNVTLTYADPGTITWGYDPGSANFGYDSPYIYRLGYPYSGNNGGGSGLAVHDSVVKTGTLRHGNWDAANNNVMWDGNIADRNVPNSLFLSSKPSWFGNLPWPPYGPTAPISGATGTTNDMARIPAGYRLLYNANPPSSGNQPPVATVGAIPLTGAAPLTVNFSSAGSFDPEGTALSYSWTFGDGGTSTAANPSRIYTNAGVYTARLIVSDGVNATSSPDLTIIATGPPTNRPPVAVAVATPSSGPAPLTVAFSSAGSLDPDGTPLSYSWVFGNGVTSSAANPSYTYTSNGTYVARLTVSDGTNSTQSAPITISVVAAGSGLVGAYGFEEGTGGSVTDVSGYNNTGTINGATWTTQGRYGQALNFNGIDGLVVINSSASLNLSSAMTLEAWVYPTASQSGWSSVLHRQPDTYYLHASSPAGAMMPAGGGIYSGVEFYCAAPSPIPLNAWTHLAATFDGSLIRFYVNGVQVSTQAASGTIQTGTNPLRVGGNTYNQFFQGRIDEVRIYNRALSAGEISTDMNTPVSSASLNPAPPTNLRVLSSN